MFSDFKRSAELRNLIGINTNMSEPTLFQFVGIPTYLVLLWIHITQISGQRKKKRPSPYTFKINASELDNMSIIRHTGRNNKCATY